MSKRCQIERGIRQWCPISYILFVICFYVSKIKNNVNIQGFKHRNSDKEIKNIQHADDMTLTLKNIESLAHAIDTIEVFGKHAGSKINLNKTECILLGTLKDQYETISGINVSKHVKCLGIYLGHDKTECYTQNWMKVYHDIEKLFEEKKINTFWLILYNKYSSSPEINIFIHNTRITARKLYKKYK